MAHFAKIDENNFVTEVIVVANQSAPTEELGQEFIASLGLDGNWKQASYNTKGNVHLEGGTPFRKNYAGIGFIYDQTRDAFIPPKPELFPSFVLDEETCLWEPPIPKPESTETIGWVWNEQLVAWETFVKPLKE